MPNRDYVKIVDTLADAPPGKAGNFIITRDTQTKYEWMGEWVVVSIGGAVAAIDGQTRHTGVNTFAELDTGVSTTIAADVQSGDISVEVADATGFAEGDYTRSSVNSGVKYPIITDITGNTITIDRPIDIGGPAGTEVFKVLINMNVVGSLASPQIFKVAPSQTSGIFPSVFHITSVNISMTHGTAGDLGLFGNLPALTNGVAIRIIVDGEPRTISSWKTNGDIKNDVFNLDFDERSGGQGVFGTTAYGVLKDSNITIRLDGDVGDELQFLVQDDLSGLDSIEIKVTGNAEDA